MASFFHSPLGLQALYATNAMWFTSAFIHFGFRGDLMMRKLTHRATSSDAGVRASPGGDAWHHDIMGYLGGMNTSLALLALLRLYGIARPSRFISSGSGAVGDVHLDIVALAVLGLANFSQAYLNFFPSRQSGRWIMGHGFDRITVLDSVFTVLDWSVAIVKIASIW